MNHATALRPALTLLTLLALATAAFALTPPEAGMLERMEREGTLAGAQDFARRLGTYELKRPKRGSLALETYAPRQIAGLIKDNFGASLSGKPSSAIRQASSQELGWVELDLNYDRVVDERDLLALGQPRPKTAATLPSLGTMKYFTLIIQFPDDPEIEGDQSYPGYFTHDHFDSMLFGEGQPGTWYHGLHYYYDKSSYGQLNITGAVYGWYTAQHPRAWYHPNDNNDYATDTSRREGLMMEAILAADAAGADFSQYDNDGDGVVDEFSVMWTGPHGDWATFWWGYHTGFNTTYEVDGVRFGSYSWQWERSYAFNATPPTPSHFSTTTVIHETGHGLGLPDWYDYDGSVGPDGGVGGLDIMHSNCDHSCYNKYLLGWINPVIAYTNLPDYAMSHSTDSQDALIIMPGFDPVSPWTEFYMAQVRKKTGIDSPAPGSGILLWHVDATINEEGDTLYDNSYAVHKQFRLMEADGLEEIETGNGSADADDYYDGTDALSPVTIPSSNNYAGSGTGITVDGISAIADTMTADYTLYTSSPPSVTLNAPLADATVSGNTTVTVSASDDVGLSKVQLLSGGFLLHEWTTFSGTQSYTWNTLTEFNGPLTLTARAFDDTGQAASDTISVTVSNSGVTAQSDTFETDLSLWRNLHHAQERDGQFSQWALRASPASPTPLGSGNEAYVAPLGTAGEWHDCFDDLRSQRLDLSGFTRPLQVKFYYRSRGNFSLWATTDNGTSWAKLADIPSASDWATFNATYSLGTGTAYLEFRYRGDVKSDSGNARGANLDNFSAAQATSDPPTVTITSHNAGDTVSGDTTFTASASDDTGVAQVVFYVHGSLKRTDTSAPFTYTRNTLNDDNYPGIEVKAVATDIDGIPSAPYAITLVWYNARPFPVASDVESGTVNWDFQNDGIQPPWALSTTVAHGGTQSMGWTGTIEASNNEGIWYLGDPPGSGRQCVDLAGPDVADPVLRFWLLGDGPTTLSSGVYLNTTWNGYEYIAGWYGPTSGWELQEISLANFVGKSGRLCWWLWSGTNTGGTGIWIDDVAVLNRNVEISAIAPARLKVGEELTITGAGFGAQQGASTITFGGGAVAGAGSIVSWSNGQIVVAVPSGAVSGNVTLHIGGGDYETERLAIILGAPVLDDVGQL